MGGAWVAWAVRALGIYAATLVYVYFMTRLSVGLFAAITLALGLLFLGGSS